MINKLKEKMNSQYLSTLNNRSEYKLDCENSYKKPMPLDMINKFVGLDSRILHQDTVVQKQAFDQSYKNFWSFVDFNIKYGQDSQSVAPTGTASDSFATNNPKSSTTNLSSEAARKMTYAEARELANKL